VRLASPKYLFTRVSKAIHCHVEILTVLKVYEIVQFWPAEVFIQRHLSAFSGMSFQPKICAKRIDYSVCSSSVQTTDQKAIEMPRFSGLTYVRKTNSIRYLWNYPGLVLDKRPWQDKLFYKFFKEAKPDLIHFHWASLAVQLAPIAQDLGIPYTFSMRGHDVKELTLDPEYVENLTKIICQSSGVHSVSDDIWQEAALICKINHGKLRHKTIYTTVPIEPLRERKNRNQSTYTFITTGRFHWMKNFVGLLIAFKKLREEGLDAKLIVVGDGDEKERMSLLFWTKYLNIKDYVSFPGTLSYSEIKDLFAHSDGYVQSSISEGFSNSLAEAMALGLSIFATDVGGTQEIIKDAKNGYLLDPEHPEKWWQKLILIRDYKNMQVLREQAWSDAREKFAAKVHARHFCEFYCNSVGKQC
jgi:colanic acid/amylovoran biosynthesis glycosyltransferase